MPLKAIYERKPLVRLQQQFLSNGQVKTKDAFVRMLYHTCLQYSTSYEMQEGLFSLACLTEKDPMKPEIASVILSEINDTEDGHFAGTITEQICIARAAFAVYEYNTDRIILKRLVQWCRYLEIQWESISLDKSLQTQAADLMGLLVTLYRITGVKAILRICSRLRAASFDWTTALHGFNQRQPLSRMMSAEEIRNSAENDEDDVSSFNTRQFILNQPELLADGLRFTAFSSLYSGNGLDVSAGRKGWSLISKYHGAICGGTTADTLLAGSGTNKAIDTACLAAWCEAFCTQMLLPDSKWASDESAIVYQNGIRAAFAEEKLLLYQCVNQTISAELVSRCFYPMASAVHTLARVARAVSCLYKTAVSVSENGFSVHHLLSGRFSSTVNGISLSIDVSEKQFCVQTKSTVHAVLDVSSLFVHEGIHVCVNQTEEIKQSDSGIFATERDWVNGDTVSIIYPEIPVAIACHHQGIGFRSGDRILCVEMEEDDPLPAVCGDPVIMEGLPSVPVKTVSKSADGTLLSDIPVLPVTNDTVIMKHLKPYAETPSRLAVLPKAKT